MSRVRTIEEAALAIVQRLREHGHQALWAGGCVRDMLLGHAPSDIDIATDAPPDRVCELFARTRRVGAQFGVVLVRQGRYWIETATFRTDLSYRDGRRPEGVVFSTPQEDALRRDFTINGLFYDPIDRKVIDYVGGQADLAARVIRAIGEPDRRFGEDHLRLLRAVRFATRFEFTIEPRTAAAIRTHAPELRRISPERVREELEKMLTHRNRAAAVRQIAELGLLAHLWPGADADFGSPPGQERSSDSYPPALRAAIDRLAALPTQADFVLAMAALLHGLPAERVRQIGRALRCSNQQVADMEWLVTHEPDLHRVSELCLAAFKRLLGHRCWPDLFALHEAVLVSGQLPTTTARAARRRAARIPRDQIAPPPLVTGDDLLALGVPPGPRYKQILDALYEAQLNETLHDRPAALARLHELVASPE